MDTIKNGTQVREKPKVDLNDLKVGPEITLIDQDLLAEPEKEVAVQKEGK